MSFIANYRSVQQMLAVIFCLFLLSSPFAAIAQQPPTIDSFILALIKKEDLWNQKPQFEIKYSRYECQDVLKSPYSRGDLLVDWDIAKKESKWVVKRVLRDPGEKSISKSNVVDSVYPKTNYFLLTNGLFCEYQETNEVCTVDHAEEVISNLFSQLVYFDFQGIGLFRKIAESNNVNYDSLLVREKKNSNDIAKNYFPEVFVKNKNNLVIHGNKEDVDGYSCWKIEWSGREVVWIDAEDHSIIRKRTKYFGTNLPIEFVAHFRDYQEVVPDLWLPYSIDVDFYAQYVVEPKSVWGKIAKHHKHKVTYINFDSVSESLINITPGIGVLVSDAVRRETYRVTDPNADPFAGPIAQGLKVNQHVKYRAIGIMIGSIMIFIAVWRLLRRTEGK
jgi:hypothetical protein